VTVTAPTPEVFIVGAGPVAGALGGALRHAGVPVLGLWGRRPDAVRAAAGIAGVAGFSAAPPDLLLEANVVLVAVADDAVTQVARTVADTGLIGKRHVLLHCSGARSAADAFGELAARVGGIGTLHPLRAIVDAREAARSLRGTVFGVEGDAAGRAMARALAEKLGGTSLDIDGQGMALYHAAASMSSNFLVTLVDAASRALAAAGVDRALAMGALAPLLRSTVENLEKKGLPEALTGPVARGDVGTVERHLAALAARVPELVELYRTLAARTVVVARQKGGQPEGALDAIAEVLAGSRPLP
jgi:predicted short-subunit dehydrogenase-like oxidoreductase (DUF2520 family)